jgi:multiple sugar transport system permease protein
MSRYRTRAFYFFIAPWFLLVLLFQVGPVVASFLLSFTEWRFVGSPEWVGLANYEEVAQDPLFTKTIQNTIYFAVGSVPLNLMVGFALAALLNRWRRGATIFRTIFFLPVVVSGVAVTLIWGWLFNNQYGLINQSLALFGIDGPSWLGDARWAMPALILMNLWSVGGNMVVYLAALQRLPRDLFEAAALDGAGWWQKLTRLTLPLVSPVTLFLTIVGVINAFQLFTPAYILTRGGPNNATLTTALYVYLNAFRWNNLGAATVMAWLLCLVIVGITVVQLVSSRIWVYYEQGEQV